MHGRVRATEYLEEKEKQENTKDRGWVGKERIETKRFSQNGDRKKYIS